MVTGAEVHDSRPAAGLIQGDKAAVYGEKAHDSDGFRRTIRNAGAADRVMHGGRQHRRLKPWQR